MRHVWHRKTLTSRYFCSRLSTNYRRTVWQDPGKICLITTHPRAPAPLRLPLEENCDRRRSIQGIQNRAMLIGLWRRGHKAGVPLQIQAVTTATTSAGWNEAVAGDWVCRPLHGRWCLCQRLLSWRVTSLRCVRHRRGCCCRPVTLLCEVPCFYGTACGASRC